MDLEDVANSGTDFIAYKLVAAEGDPKCTVCMKEVPFIESTSAFPFLNFIFVPPCLNGLYGR
jgi:hypothetical protein